MYSTLFILTAGTAVPQYEVAVMADAMNAANRFSNAGRTQVGLLPATSTYLSIPAAGVLEQRNTSGSSLQQAVGSTVPATVVPAEEEAGEGVLPACTTALSCNRENSYNTRAELDICGLVSVVCTHGFPALGCTIAMTAAENHSYYDAAFEHLFRSKSTVRQVYLDLMCRYKGRLRRLLERLVAGGYITPECLDVKLLIPWMHAFDHDLTCQLKFSGLYAEGVGRRVGEQTESLWSVIKPFAKKARYMAFRNWWDSYNFLFRHLTFLKQREMPISLERKLKKIGGKIGEYFYFSIGPSCYASP